MIAALLRFFNRPSVHIISGIIIILCGLSNMEEGIDEFSKQNNLGGDRIGLLFLGLSATITKGVISLFKFLESTARGAAGMKRADFKIVHSIRKTVEHWFFDFAGGILILMCGLLEVFENWFDNEAANNDNIIWFFGLVAVGVVKIITSLPEMIEATVMLEHVEHKKGWNMKAFHTISRRLRNQRLEVSLAFFLITMGITEEIFLPMYRDGYSFGLGMHHGILIYGFNHLSKILPDFLASKALIQDAFADGM